MQITHLGHSAVLVEVSGVRLLIDPGNFSDAWHDLVDLDAILRSPAPRPHRSGARAR